MGILRNTLIIGGLAVGLPAPPPTAGDGAVQPQSSTIAYVAAAADAYTDVRNFCQRKPGVCQTAGHIAMTMEAKAKYSAKLIYEWANEATEQSNAKPGAKDELADADPIATGAIPNARHNSVSQSTLKLEDLLPEWQAPKTPLKG